MVMDTSSYISREAPFISVFVYVHNMGKRSKGMLGYEPMKNVFKKKIKLSLVLSYLILSPFTWGYLPTYKEIKKLLNQKDQLAATEQLNKWLSEELDYDKNQWLKSPLNPLGATLLHLAVMNNCVSIVKYLLEIGACCDIGNINNTTPLHYAATVGHLKIMELLIAHGASVNMANNHGDTPLHWAADSGRVDAVKYLIQHKALINVQNNHEQTPLSLALEQGFHEIYFLMQETQEFTIAANQTQITPLESAVTLGATTTLFPDGATGYSPAID